MEGVTYPPAAAAEGTVGFWQGFASPSNFVEMVQATWDHSAAEFGTWFERSTEAGDEGLAAVYVDFFDQFVQVMVSKAAPLTAFAIFGFLVERYGAERSRNLVMFAAYCGFVSVLGYPLGTDIFGAWLVVHALVPLSIPAAVGLARIFDWGTGRSFSTTRSASPSLPCSWYSSGRRSPPSPSRRCTATPSPTTTISSSTPSPAATRAPNSRPSVLSRARAATGRTSSSITVSRASPATTTSPTSRTTRTTGTPRRLDTRPLCARWYNSLPFPWYFAKDDADVDCTRERAQLESRIQSNPPPVIITQDADSTVPTGALESSYTRTTYEMRVYGKGHDVLDSQRRPDRGE